MSPGRKHTPIYAHSLALLQDFYQLTMSYGYWKTGLAEKEAVFHLFFRRQPFGGGFTIASGLESVVEYLKNFHFDESDLNYLSSLRSSEGAPLFEEDFFTYLSKLKFSCDIDAVPEGNVVFPFEPLVRVQGPLIQAQLLETPLLNLINFPTLIATKAARLCVAAQGDPVFEFGLRRAQGIDGGLTASRAAFVGGCVATSNVLAGKRYDIPVRGTQAHSWIMAFDSEMESFQTYAKVMPDHCVLLVDTYDTMEGVRRAIEVGHMLRKQGKTLAGIRLDSGDLADLSIRSRDLLNSSGFSETQIIASNELDETIISDLKRQGAKIDVWGVGTNLVTASNQPALDGVYKLSAIRDKGGEWAYKLKLSEKMTKVSNPGIMQVKRFIQDGQYVADALYDVNLDLQPNSLIVDPFDPTKVHHQRKGWTSRDLLVPIFKGGKQVYDLPKLTEIRETTKRELGLFPKGIKRFIYPHEYNVGMEKKFYDLKVNLIREIRESNPIKEPA
jgi:nicotinate phosphoribosyltransferase